MRAFHIVVCGLFAAPLFAQTVTLTAVAITPITARAGDGTSLFASTQGPGPLPPYGGVQASQVGVPAIATSAWGVALGPYGCDFGWSQTTLVNTPAATAFAEVSPADVLLSVQASSPVTVRFAVWRELVVTAGAAMPISRIDIDADGSFEFTETSPMYGTTASFVLGPNPRQIHIRTGVSLNGAGHISANGVFQVVPDNNLQIVQMVSPCGGDKLQVFPTFAGDGIAVETHPVPWAFLTVVVLGLAVQPVLVPSPLPACVLMPSPDLLVPLSPSQTFALPLPPAVRPVTVYTQGITLINFSLTDLTTTNGFRVIAW